MFFLLLFSLFSSSLTTHATGQTNRDPLFIEKELIMCNMLAASQLIQHLTDDHVVNSSINKDLCKKHLYATINLLKKSNLLPHLTPALHRILMPLLKEQQSTHHDPIYHNKQTLTVTFFIINLWIQITLRPVTEDGFLWLWKIFIEAVKQETIDPMLIKSSTWAYLKIALINESELYFSKAPFAGEFYNSMISILQRFRLDITKNLPLNRSFLIENLAAQ